MTDDDVKKLIERLARIQIAIESINPDPAQTIQAHRDQREAQQRAANGLVIATDGLVKATKRVATATWALVALTAILALATLGQLLLAPR